jgi:hypothetical protein
VWLLVGAFLVFILTVVVVLVVGERRARERLLDPLAILLADGPAPTLSRRGDAWISGSWRGRPARIGLFDRRDEEYRWQVMVDLACESSAIFDLGRQDGPESYAAQIANPILRAAVHRLVETPEIASVALNASSPPLPLPYRLRVTMEQTRRRPILVRAVAQAIIQEADEIARLIEEQGARR